MKKMTMQPEKAYSVPWTGPLLVCTTFSCAAMTTINRANKATSGRRIATIVMESLKAKTSLKRSPVPSSDFRGPNY